jgi:hypothetical protein
MSKLLATYTLLTITQGINTSVVGNASVLSTLQTSVSGNDTALGNRITSVNNNLTTETNSRVGNDSLKANLVGDNVFVGTQLINGKLVLNTTLNILDGAGNNGTTVIGDTIWTNSLYVTNIGQANILNPMLINGSNIPRFDNQFDLGNSSNRWRNTSTNQLNANIMYENGISLNTRYNQTAMILSVGNWTADKSSYNTTAQNNNLYYAKSNPNSYYNSSTIPTYATITQYNNLYTNVTNLQSTSGSLATNLTNEINARISIGNYSADGMPKAGGTFTGNVTMSAGVTNILTPSAGKFYIWYVNATVWDCYNGTGTIYNRGNASVVC